MSNFMGGSAFAMARDIGEGYQSVTDRTFKKMTVPELTKLTHEMDRALRELRGSPASPDDMMALKARNRKIQRLNSAMMILRMHRQTSRR